jgi:hypothetical protein
MFEKLDALEREVCGLEGGEMNVNPRNSPHYPEIKRIVGRPEIRRAIV